MTRPKNPQHAARQYGARILRFPDLQPATQQDFGKPRTALFIHGFTADAGYMQDLMHQFTGSGFTSLAFEYPSDRGIHQAAKVLRERLESFDQGRAISDDRLVLVCHSMGGLVARALIAFEGGDRYVRKIITLGTPHDGTLKSATLLRFLLYWGEHVSGLNPHAFSAKSISAVELLQRDTPPPLLDRMLAAGPKGSSVEFFSISGGLAQLEFGIGALPSKLVNVYVQTQLAKPNDGLVQEQSSDLSGNVFKSCAPGSKHINSYAEFPHTNHTYLVRNQGVAMNAIGCAQ